MAVPATPIAPPADGPMAGAPMAGGQMAGGPSVDGRVAEAAVAAAVDALAGGAVIGLPTETVYGLAADAGNRAAVAAIYRIKGRPADHPLIVHVLGSAEARHWADWSGDAERLARAFWPGPLTMVLPRRADAPAWACAGQSTIGLRAPSHPVARAVLEGLAARGITGVAAPSANRFGRVSPTSAAHVRDDLGADVEVVLDGGEAEVGVESTIVDLSRAVPVVLRPGHLTEADLARALGRPIGEAAQQTDARPAPRVPGALASHYAPVTPLELLEPARVGVRAEALQRDGRRVAVWSRARQTAARWDPLPDDPHALEQCLYARMRALDAGRFDAILVEHPGTGPAWAAVVDRLTRAAHR